MNKKQKKVIRILIAATILIALKLIPVTGIYSFGAVSGSFMDHRLTF